jgi:hypothetical protein
MTKSLQKHVAELRELAAARLRLWQAYGLRLVSDLCFAADERLARKPCGLDWIGYWIDRLGCASYEAAYRRVDEVLDKVAPR